MAIVSLRWHYMRWMVLALLVGCGSSPTVSDPIPVDDAAALFPDAHQDAQQPDSGPDGSSRPIRCFTQGCPSQGVGAGAYDGCPSTGYTVGFLHNGQYLPCPVGPCAGSACGVQVSVESGWCPGYCE